MGILNNKIDCHSCHICHRVTGMTKMTEKTFIFLHTGHINHARSLYGKV